MLHERSNMKYKLGPLVWPESLKVAIEKFEIVRASPTDIAFVIKKIILPMALP